MTPRRPASNRYATWHPPRDLQQVGLHVDDLVFAVPFAAKDVLQAVGLETDGAVDEAVLVGAGVVPECGQERCQDFFSVSETVSGQVVPCVSIDRGP